MKLLLLSLLTFAVLQSFAQEAVIDTVHTLSEIVVSESRIERFSAGLQVSTLNKQSYAASPGILLSELLSVQGTHFIKSYGAGGLASISMRGTAAQHTAIYWNGFNINPPNIDMADLSMLPLFLFNRVDIVSGGSSTLFGNGSIGGSIHLNSQNGYKEGQLKLALLLGQYSDRMLGLKTDYRLGGMYLSTSAWVNSSSNDFVYVNSAKFGNPKERLSNADAANLGLLQELHLPITTHQHVKAGFWYQEREAGIPPSMTMHASHARQHDRMMRGYIQWNFQAGNSNYILKSGYNSDFLNYTDTLIGLDSHISVGAWTTEAELATKLSKNSHLVAGANYQVYNASVDAYQEQVNPSQLSLFTLANHEFPNLNWLINAGVRKEFHSDFKNIPPALSLGWKGRLAKQLSGRLNVSTNYRAPTLNDRYWQPGGNSGLKAETSFNTEAGLDLSFENERTKVFVAATFFNNRIKNRITWLPTASTYWSPENISEVFSYGVETKITTLYDFHNLCNRFEIAYSAVRSIYGATSFSDMKTQPQLIYTPVHTLSAFYVARTGKWSFQYFHKLTGSRYTDRANTNKLPAFHTADISLARTLGFQKINLTLNASVKNITNHAYQVIEYRPMPGRTFNISLIFDLIFKNHSQPKPVKQ